MSRGFRWFWLFFVAPPLFLLFIVLGGVVVMLLWNWLLPALFGWPELGFWQALGLLALCRILFGGFGVHRGPRHHLRRRFAERWGERWDERWERMTPEQRERFRKKMRERWGFEGGATEGAGE